MARRKQATVEYLSGKTWSLHIRSSDPQLRANLVDVIEESEKRGLLVLNAADPFEGVKMPRNPKAKKVVQEHVEGGKTNE